MINTLVVVLAVIACPFIWTMMIVPLIARCFGVPIRIGSLPIDRRSQRLGKRQSFWFGGVLGWGVGLSLMGALVQRFIDQTQSSVPSLIVAFVCTLIVGGLAACWIGRIR